jgi:hypothetical protein
MSRCSAACSKPAYVARQLGLVSFRVVINMRRRASPCSTFTARPGWTRLQLAARMIFALLVAAVIMPPPMPAACPIQARARGLVAPASWSPRSTGRPGPRAILVAPSASRCAATCLERLGREREAVSAYAIALGSSGGRRALVATRLALLEKPRTSRSPPG